MLKNRHHLEQYKYDKYIIVPDSLKTLEMWIVGSNRIERMNEIKKDFLDNYNEIELNKLQDEGFKIIRNGFGLLDDIVEEIANKSNCNGSPH